MRATRLRMHTLVTKDVLPSQALRRQAVWDRSRVLAEAESIRSCRRSLGRTIPAKMALTLAYHRMERRPGPTPSLDPAENAISHLQQPAVEENPRLLLGLDQGHQFPPVMLYPFSTRTRRYAYILLQSWCLLYWSARFNKLA